MIIFVKSVCGSVTQREVSYQFQTCCGGMRKNSGKIWIIFKNHIHIITF